MSDENSIQVNFGKPIALFPLDGLVLLPQQVIPLHIFEPRYRQMVEQALDGSGQIALALLAGNRWKQEYHARPPIRPAVCIAQIMQHEKLPDGRFNILVQGVCRARVVQEEAPVQGRLFRAAYLEPVGLEPGNQLIIQTEFRDEDGPGLGEGADESGDEHEPPSMPLTESVRVPEPEGMEQVRSSIEAALSEGPLTRLSHAEVVLEYVRNEDVPVAPLMELVSFTLISEPRVRYKLLAEADIKERAKIILAELDHIGSLIRRAIEQRPQDWPKGLSWN